MAMITSVQKVQAALQEKGFPCGVVELADSTRTAKEAAQAVGCQLGQIVKSLVFRTIDSSRAVLVVASGPNRVDEGLLSRLLGEGITKADADFVRERTGYVIGGVPPLGHATPLVTFIDEDLLQFDEVWAAAGTPHAVFCLKSSDLPAMTGGQLVKIHA